MFKEKRPSIYVNILLSLNIVILIIHLTSIDIFSEEFKKRTIKKEIGNGYDESLKQFEGNSKKIIFDTYANEKEDLKQYVDYVWAFYVKTILTDDQIKHTGVSKGHISIAIADLDGNGRKDIIASFRDDNYFCGKFGTLCNMVIFISIDFQKYKKIPVNILYDIYEPMYILNSESKGLKDIIVGNGNRILKYDGKKYDFKRNE
jgi:hypothetical protein